MLAAQNAFEPTEEKFDRPAILVAQRNPRGVEIQAIARQQKHFRPALAIGLAVRDFDDAQLLLEYRAALLATEPNHTIAQNARYWRVEVRANCGRSG